MRLIIEKGYIELPETTIVSNTLNQTPVGDRVILPRRVCGNCQLWDPNDPSRRFQNDHLGWCKAIVPFIKGSLPRGNTAAETRADFGCNQWEARRE